MPAVVYDDMMRLCPRFLLCCIVIGYALFSIAQPWIFQSLKAVYKAASRQYGTLSGFWHVYVDSPVRAGQAPPSSKRRSSLALSSVSASVTRAALAKAACGFGMK